MILGDASGSLQESPTDEHESPTSPSFAPRGRPALSLRSKFRTRLPPPLQLSIPRNETVAAIHNTCSVCQVVKKCEVQALITWQKAVNSTLGRADNARFLERFRYIIVASQLLNAHSYFGQANYPSRQLTLPIPDAPQEVLTLTGTATTAAVAFALAWMIHWVRGGKQGTGLGRVAVVLVAVGILAVISYSYIRRQWLQYLRQQTLSEVSHFVGVAQEFDTAASAALTLVQEVELVSRGYRLYVESTMVVESIADIK